uniref:glycosyltransferase family 4 protein n=1 Tax=Thaumasiovibrio occultus TaxID=1891184 RepID=UPI000B34ADE6|nr:glycosyltransferase family 4 protein [Thaumasiovibrio occultus]
MKVMLLLDSSGFGGIETHILQLATMLTQRDCVVEVVFLQAYSGHPLYAALERQQIAYCFASSSSHHAVRGLSRCIAQLGKGDIVHAHGYKASILARVLCRYSGVRCITTFHAGEQGKGRLRFYEWLNRASACLSQNLAVSRVIQARLPVDSILVHNFIATDDIGFAPKAPSRPLNIGFVGRLSEEKGIDRFIALSKRHPVCRWHVFGDGPLRQAVLDADHVVFHGQVDAMDEHWSQLDLVLMPSRFEGLPLTAIEAMARGIPVFATQVGLLNALIDGNWLVEEADWQQLSRKLEAALGWSDQQWFEYQQACRHKVDSDFSAQSAWLTYAEIYGFSQLAEYPIEQGS